MKDFLNSLKIPTILGLGIIIVGIISGVFLTLKAQVFTSQASPDINVQNLNITNISDSEVVISWQTSIPVASFITVDQASPGGTTVLDDRDTKTPSAYLTHYVTIKNLLPKTTYFYKIVSGKNSTQADRFTTAVPIDGHTTFRPIIGSVLDGDKPLNEGVAYLSIADSTTHSAQIVSSGNFLIPVSQIRTADMLSSFPLTEDTLAKLTIVSPKGQATALFKIKDADFGLPSLRLGQDLDFTDISEGWDLTKYDLNTDGKINAADNAIILDSLGKNPKEKRADLNGDGEVNQEDLDLMAQELKDGGTQ